MLRPVISEVVNPVDTLANPFTHLQMQLLLGNSSYTN